MYTMHNAEEQIAPSECIVHVHPRRSARKSNANNPWKMLVRPLLTHSKKQDARSISLPQMRNIEGKCTRCWRCHYMTTRAYWIFFTVMLGPIPKQTPEISQPPRGFLWANANGKYGRNIFIFLILAADDFEAFKHIVSTEQSFGGRSRSPNKWVQTFILVE